jgi:hypothetical protein
MNLADWWWHRRHHYPRFISIIQVHRRGHMAVTGVQAGSTGTFQELPQPAGTQFPAGTTFVWSVDDTANVTLSPSSDGTTVVAAVSATDTNASFNLTVTSSFTPPGGSTPLAATVNVPVLAAPVPTPTGMEINQIA